MPDLDGRYLLAAADATASRDPIALQMQAKHMREVGKANDWDPALILVVVDQAHKDEAVERLRTALNGEVEDA